MINVRYDYFMHYLTYLSILHKKILRYSGWKLLSWLFEKVFNSYNISFATQQKVIAQVYKEYIIRDLSRYDEEETYVVHSKAATVNDE